MKIKIATLDDIQQIEVLYEELFLKCQPYNQNI